MKFEDFVATKRAATKADLLRLSYIFMEDQPVEAFIYAGALVIEDTSVWTDKAPWLKQYYLMLGNSEYTEADLSVLELRLFEYAVSEGVAWCTNDEGEE
jgi:hypothetical protein